MNRPDALALCTTAIGDTLLCTPAIRALGQVFALDVLVHQKRRPLLEGNPYVHRIYSYRNNFFQRAVLALNLGRNNYERLVVLHSNDDLLKLLPRLNYQKAANIQGWRRPELNLSALEPDPQKHVVQNRLALADWAGAGPLRSVPNLEIYLTAQELEAGRRWLDERGLGDRRPLAAFCVGAANLHKIWPAERFGRVAGALAQDGAGVFVVGSKAEEGLFKRVRQSAGQEITPALDMDLRLLAAVLAAADLLITNDTGPLHLAQAVGTPVLGIYGPTDPTAIGPLDPASRVLKVPIICEKCITKACPYPKCLEALSPEEVLAEARQMLAGLGGRS